MTFRRSLLRAWRASAFAVLAGAALFVALCEARLRAFAVAHLLVAATTCGAALFLGRLWYASWPRASVDDEGDTNAAANGYDAKVVAFLMLGMYPLLFELCSFLTGCNDRGNAAPAWLPLFLVLMLFYILSALVSVDVFSRRTPDVFIFDETEPPSLEDEREAERRRKMLRGVAEWIAQVGDRFSLPPETRPAALADKSN